MPLILKRYVVRDANGRPITLRIERVTDDGSGRVQSSDEQTARSCTGCGRFIVDLGQQQGICHVCHCRECCEHCGERCAVCHRQLCGQCRRGFAGPPALTVCDPCLDALRARQRLEDYRLHVAADFDRHIEQQRLLTQIEAQRRSAEQAQVSLQLQAARLGVRLGPPPPLWKRIISVLVRTVFRPVQHDARRALP